jgi:hypothetical protein
MDWLLLALLMVVIVVVGWNVRQHMLSVHVEPPAETPVARPTLVPPPPPKQPGQQLRTVVLEDKDKPLDYPKFFQVQKVGHRIWDATGCAWDRVGRDTTGHAVYRRTLGQGVQRQAASDV